MTSWNIETPARARKGAESPRREGVLVVAWGSLIPILGLVVSPFAVILAVIIYASSSRAPTAAGQTFALLTASVFGSLPVGCVASLAAAWTLWFLRRQRLAEWALLAPAVWVIALVMIWGLSILQRV